MAYLSVLKVPSVSSGVIATDGSCYDTLLMTGGIGTILVTVTGAPTGGTFTLTYGAQTTTALAYNATAAQVQAALVALSSITAGCVQVVGAPGGPWNVQFIGSKANTVITAMTHTDSLTPSGAVAIAAGSPGSTTLISTLTDVFISFVPTFGGADTPYAVIYASDLNGTLVTIDTLTYGHRWAVLTSGSGKWFGNGVEVKVFPGLSTLPAAFALSIEGK